MWLSKNLSIYSTLLRPVIRPDTEIFRTQRQTRVPGLTELRVLKQHSIFLNNINGVFRQQFLKSKYSHHLNTRLPSDLLVSSYVNTAQGHSILEELI